MYHAVYTDEGIWAIGSDPEDAIAQYLNDTGIMRDELSDERTAPMTDRLAEYVDAHGYNCDHDCFTILRDGTLDMVEGN